MTKLDIEIIFESAFASNKDGGKGLETNVTKIFDDPEIV